VTFLVFAEGKTAIVVRFPLLEVTTDVVVTVAAFAEDDDEDTDDI
jgi:hypothetical protein